MSDKQYKKQIMKPCPFCGVPIDGEMDFHIDYEKDHPSWYWFDCGSCGAIGAKELTVDDAIFAWNERHEIPS